MRERGAAVAEFVLVMTLLIPLVLGIIQVGLVLHVRNTATAAAVEGARTAATLDATLARGVERTRAMLTDSLDDRFAEDVSARYDTRSGIDAVRVTVRGRVPTLGMFGPAVTFTVHGHAVREVTP